MSNNVAFLFDLDGVLVDSEREYTRIWETINQEYPTGVENFEIKIKGTTLTNILATYYPEPEERANVEKMLYKLEQEMVYSYCIGAKELLDSIRDRQIPTALVTSSNDIKMAHLYKDLPHFKEFFVKVIDDHCVHHSKPDPEGYLLGAEATDVEISHCCVVEDSLQGVRAGRCAGAYVVGVAGTLPKETLAPECDIVVESLKEINLDKLIGILKCR
ncbi:MAG: HAD family phosphatase [Clostridium sp.]|nr:HAD family phosphatase [Clostridium sp.]MCM1475164.1 HAD family phosphatase [Muribaculaceae bacterium]